MKTLRIDTWLYNLGMTVSVLAVAVSIPAGFVLLAACVGWALGLL